MGYFKHKGCDSADQQYWFPLRVEIRVLISHKGHDSVEIDAPRYDDEIRAGRYSSTPAGCSEEQQGHVELRSVEEVGQRDEGDNQEGGFN